MTSPESTTVNDCLERLAKGPWHRLGELLATDVPKLPGLYALWHDDELLYVGIAVVDPKDTTNPRAAGVQGRLRTYLDARLTSDFTLAVALRFVVAHLTADELRAIADGSMQVRDLHRLVNVDAA